MTKAHLILINSTVLTKYWSEAIRVVNYLRNRSSNIRLEIILYEKNHEIKLDLSHVRIWDFKGLTLKHDKNFKFKKKVTLCRLIEYENDHIYRLLSNDELIFRVIIVKWLKKRSRRSSESASFSSDFELKLLTKRHKAEKSEEFAVIMLSSSFSLSFLFSFFVASRLVRSDVSSSTHINESLIEILT